MPVALLPCDRRGGRLVPCYLTERDHPWLTALLGEYERFVGRRRGELRERLKEPLPVPAPAAGVRLAARVLDRKYADRVVAKVPPRRVREAVFRAATDAPSRTAALVRAAAELSVEVGQLPELLFADLPPERRLAPLAAPLSAAELALLSNHAMIAALLRRAVRVRLRAEGEVRPLLQAIKLRGLLCDAVPDARGRAVTLDISGPYALFRHTLVYGRALASLVARAAACHRFELRALCALSAENDLAELTVRSGDPVVPATPGRAYDSAVERRLARDLGQLAPDWDIVREPRAVRLPDGWIFPDFLLQHRRQAERRWLLEIVGFWTPEYLERKLRRLRQARLERFIVCIDEARNCSDADLPAGARVLRYRRRVPAEAVLRLIEGEGP